MPVKGNGGLLVVGDWLVVGDLVVGDWARKYRMGEVEGGIMRDGGVSGCEEELAEPDDVDETETSESESERDLLLRVPMGMGSEQVFFDSSFEDI